MLNRSVAGISAAALLTVAISTAGLAQSPGASAPLPTSGEPIEVSGCVVREADYALATGAAPTAGDPSASAQQLVVAAGGAAAPAYVVTGIRESDLARYIGRRVEITGTVEQVREAARPGQDGSSTAVPSKGRLDDGIPPAGSTGVTPGGSPAHEAGDAVPGTAPAAAGTAGTPATARPDASLSAMARINVASFRAVDGECDELRASDTTTRAQEPSRSQNEAPAPKPPVPPPAAAEPITAVGCLVRQTPGGTALSSQTVPPGDDLVLSGAAVAPTGAANASAVPGSAPSGSGSGTVPSSSSAARTNPAVAPDRSFSLHARSAGERAALAKLVGQRIEIVGIVEDDARDARGRTGRAPGRTDDTAAAGTSGRVETAAPVSHPSAPLQRLTVSSFRALVGSCN